MRHRDDERDVAGAVRERITGHLGFAIAGFPKIEMQPSLERALGHKEIRGAPVQWQAFPRLRRYNFEVRRRRWQAGQNGRADNIL